MSAIAIRTTMVRYDAMCKAIAECHSVDEVKDLRDRAKALEVYARQAQNFEAERKAGEIRIRAERRAGEMLREMKGNGQRAAAKDGGRPITSRDTRLVISRPPTLSDLGITRDQSSKWQQLANVPEEEFESAVRGAGPMPTTEGIINAEILRKHPMPRMDPGALWLWGRLCDFERHGLLNREAGDLFAAMTDSMKDDCARIVPQVAAWLKEMQRWITRLNN